MLKLLSVLLITSLLSFFSYAQNDDQQIKQLIEKYQLSLNTSNTEMAVKLYANGQQINEGNNELFIFKKHQGQWQIQQYLFSTNQPKS